MSCDSFWWNDEPTRSETKCSAPLEWRGTPKIIHRGAQEGHGESGKPGKMKLQNKTEHNNSFNHIHHVQSVNVQLSSVHRVPELQTQSCSSQVHDNIKLLLEPNPKSTKLQQGFTTTTSNHSTLSTKLLVKIHTAFLRTSSLTPKC